MAQAKRCRLDLDAADSEHDDSDGSSGSGSDRGRGGGGGRGSGSARGEGSQPLHNPPSLVRDLPPPPPPPPPSRLYASRSAAVVGCSSSRFLRATPCTIPHARCYPEDSRDDEDASMEEATRGCMGMGTGSDDSKDDGDEEEESIGGCSMLALPNEVLVAIMQQHSFTEVAESFRLVCRRFAQVSAIVLNSGLHRVGQALEMAMAIQESNMETATTDNEMSVAARAFGALEFARMQWRMVEAIVWRHGIEAFGQGTGGAGGTRACCLCGRLLDRLCHLCSLSREDPVGLAWSFHYGSAYRTTSARRRLAHDTKRFLNLYEKYAERNINAGPRVCGTKMVDLLLGLHDKKCIEIDEAATGLDADTGLFRLRASFTLPRTWFTCFHVQSRPSERSVREQHRFMFLRMRRLVAACNESALEHVHYEREFSQMLMRMHTPWRASVTLPLASKYAAFGHCCDQFFFYGALNERAFDDRFRSDPLLEILGPTLAEGLTPVPAMEVRVDVRLVCPPSLAPLSALRRLRFEDIDPVASSSSRAAAAATSSDGPFALEMDIHCSASRENRLPARFQWRVSDADADADGNWLPALHDDAAASPSSTTSQPPPPAPPPSPDPSSKGGGCGGDGRLSSASSSPSPSPPSPSGGGRRGVRRTRHAVAGRNVRTHLRSHPPNTHGTP